LASAPQPIRIAFYGWQQAEARTKQRVISILTDVRRITGELYRRRRELEVRKSRIRSLAVAQLERARARSALAPPANPKSSAPNPASPSNLSKLIINRKRRAQSASAIIKR
jgi:hypothetical protein